MTLQPEDFWSFSQWLLRPNAFLESALLQGIVLFILAIVLGLAAGYVVSAARYGPVEGFYALARAIRALLKANALCTQDVQTAAALIDRHGEEFGGKELILRSLNDIPYDAWRNYDLKASLRFYALRLHEAGLVNRTPNDLLKLASDFEMFEQLRLELKA